MRVGGICEVILYVRDMEKQVAFYRDTLGLEISYPREASDLAGESWVTFATGACTLALHGGGDGDFGEDAPKVVFTVSDVEGANEHLKSFGLPVGTIHEPAPGIRVFDAQDPEGNWFSLEENAQGADQDSRNH